MEEKSIPLAEEELEVGKRRRVTGTVRVDRTVRDEEVPVEADLLAERIDIRRVAMDRPVDGPLPDRWEGDTLVVSVVEEVLVVEKRLKLVEEIHLTRRREHLPASATVTLRKEVAEVRRE